MALHLQDREAELNVLDLFSGVGGFSLGLERAGMRTVAFCEIDPFCRRVLAKHWPEIKIGNDVTERDFIEGEADLISAGFPCQDISFAGEGAGLAGARSGLYRHVIRALRLVRPKFAVLENVSALLSRGLDTVLGDMAEVGYDAEWHCIPASAVGAPHRRDRIWIIADTGGEQYESGRPPFSGSIAEELSRANSDAEAMLGASIIGSKSHRNSNCAEEMADAEGDRQRRRLCPRESSQQRRGRSGDSGSANGWWSVEPDVGRVAHGVPSRVDRLRALGNAVVPQIPELIGRAIMKVANADVR